MRRLTTMLIAVVAIAVVVALAAGSAAARPRGFNGVGEAGSVHQSLARTRLAKRALSKGGDAALSVVASEPQLIHH